MTPWPRRLPDSTTPSAAAGKKPIWPSALADRLDSLAGLFAAGLAPKGSNVARAPRAALRLIENHGAHRQPFDLGAAFAAAAALLPVPGDDAVLAEVLGFVNGRLEGVLR